MPNPFEILSRFLARYNEEVEGRGMTEAPEAIRPELRALARGELSENDRKSLFDKLHANPQWLDQLAGEVKSLRGGRDSADPPKALS